MQISFLSVVGLLLLATVTAADDSIVDLGKARIDKKFQPFIGSYIASSPEGTSVPAALSVRDGYIRFDWLPANILNGVVFPTTRKVTHYTSRHSSTLSGKVELVKEVTLNEDVLEAVKTTTGKRGKSVETHTFTRSGNYLDYHFTRKFFVRKYGLFGPWVDDKKSFNAKRNAFDILSRYVKTSSVPMPYEIFNKIAEQRPESVVQLKSQEDINQFLEEYRRDRLAPVHREILEEEAPVTENRRTADVIRLDEKRNIPRKARDLSLISSAAPSSETQLKCILKKLTVIESPPSQ